MIFTISGLNGKSNNLADVCLRIHLLALGFVYVNVLPIKSFKHVSSLGIAWDVLERCCSLAWKVVSLNGGWGAGRVTVLLIFQPSHFIVYLL